MGELVLELGWLTSYSSLVKRCPLQGPVSSSGPCGLSLERCGQGHLTKGSGLRGVKQFAVAILGKAQLLEVSDLQNDGGTKTE